MEKPKMYPINPVIDEKLEQIRTLDKSILSKENESLHLKREWLSDCGWIPQVVNRLGMNRLDKCIAKELKSYE